MNCADPRAAVRDVSLPVGVAAAVEGVVETFEETLESDEAESASREVPTPHPVSSAADASSALHGKNRCLSVDIFLSDFSPRCGVETLVKNDGCGAVGRCRDDDINCRCSVASGVVIGH